MEAKEASVGTSGKALEPEPAHMENGGAAKAYKRSVTRHEEEPTGLSLHTLARSPALGGLPGAVQHLAAPFRAHNTPCMEQRSCPATLAA